MLAKFMGAALAVLALHQPVLAQAPAWPSRPVKIVLGLPPGSGSDLLARALAAELGDTWKQPVVVENKPGANGIVATVSVAKAPPDGHTLLLAIDANITTNPFVYKALPYDPVKDLAPVTQLMTFSSMLVAHPSVGARTLPEIVARAKAAPGKLTYASMGGGSNMHLLSETLEKSAGIELLHVPYKGVPQMSNALLTGEVQLGWLGAFTAKPLVEEGRLRAIAISGPKRSALMPDVPSMGELGYKDVEVVVWYGLMAPGGTPRAIVERIHGAVATVLAQPAFRDRHLTPKGYEPSALGPQAFAEYIRRELASRAELVKLSGITPQE
jgi:tripartite-type tricarboxylate transporter receptor subunit TctC